MEASATLGALAILIGAIAYTIYIKQTLRKGGVEPHPFSWLLWGLVTLVAFFVQFSQGGKAGSWVTGFTAVVCFFVGCASLFKNQWHFSWFDWASVCVGLCVVAFYLLAKNPTYSAIFATAADVVGYGPTLKKGWREPRKDSATSFGLNGLKFLVAFFALGQLSIATYLYPLTIFVVNSGVAAMLLLRRNSAATPAIQRRAIQKKQ